MYDIWPPPTKNKELDTTPIWKAADLIWLFGASTFKDHHSVAEPSDQLIKEQRDPKGDRVQKTTYSSETIEARLESLCHGETLHQPLVVKLGYLGSQSKMEKQS